MYRRFGLSIRQIDIVADATPKRHYWPFRRSEDAGSSSSLLGPAALAFIGAGSKDDVLSARRMIEQHGKLDAVEWLRARGLHDWAEYLDRLNGLVETPADAILGVNGIPAVPHQREEDSSRGDTSMKAKRFFRLLSAVSVAVVWLLIASSVPARAQFGGSQIVFDPQMFARQMQQLQQETATVTNLAQQLQYAIKNTTGGGAGVWQSNQNLLTNLGDLINQQEGLSYTFQSLTQQFQQLYPGFNAASTAGVQSPQTSTESVPR